MKTFGDAEPWVIYVLKDPRNMKVRYVGFTCQLVERRLSLHLSEARRIPNRNHRTKWIASLLSNGLRPMIEIIESGVGPQWGEVEKRWIALYRSSGHLVNSTDGGDGVVGWGTHEQRSEMMKAANARRPAKERSDTARKREAAKTPEVRFRIAENARLRMMARPPEERSTWAHRMNASRSPEERRAIARLAHANQSVNRSAAARKRYAQMSPEERSGKARHAAQIRWRKKYQWYQ